ncbi:unnamed protein product [Sympodiomycopsis kandeliae]
MVRSVTFEIRWHDTQPIYSCSFQPITPPQLKKVLDYNLGQSIGLPPDKTVSHSNEHDAGGSASTSQQQTSKNAPLDIAGGQNWRLATAGGDNNIRIWLVKPSIPSPAAMASVPQGMPTPTPHPPRVEYLATLSRHSGVVNCVRFSPSGDLLASAGDDGTVMLWHLTDRPLPAFGGGVSADLADDPSHDAAFEKEHWRMTRMIRVSTQEIYDMAWSPNGEHLIVGGTDFVARIINPHDGTVLKEFSDHTHYVQGVAWDPLDGYLATQSSDRSVHVHVLQHANPSTTNASTTASTSATSSKRGDNSYVPPVTRNSKLDVHRRTNSASASVRDIKPNLRRGSSHTSHVESDTDGDEGHTPHAAHPSSSSSSSSAAAGPSRVTPRRSASQREGFTAVRGRTGRSHTPMDPPQTTPMVPSLSSTPHLPARAATPTPASSVPQSPAFSTASASAYPMNPPQRTPSRRSSFSGSQAEGATSPPTSIASFAPQPSGSAASIYKAFVGDASHHQHHHHHHPNAAAAPASTAATATAAATARRSMSRPASVRSPSPAPLPAIRPPPSPRQRIQAAQQIGASMTGAIPSSSSSAAAAAAAYTPLQMGMRMYGDEAFSGFFRRLAFSPDGALLVTPSGIFEAQQTTPASPSLAMSPTTSKSPGFPPHGSPHAQTASSPGPVPPRSTVYLYGRASLTRPNAPLAHLPGHKTATLVVRFSPILYELRKTHASAFAKSEDGGGVAPHPNIPLEAGKQKSVNLNPQSSTPDPKQSQDNNLPSHDAPPPPASMIGLPYRMIFAVATHDVVWIYDTQQGGPLCCFSNMHYASFTDLTWSSDGQTLIMSSSDGYCSVAVFDHGELGTPYTYTAQPCLQSNGSSSKNTVVPPQSGTPVTTLPTKKKQPPPQLATPPTSGKTSHNMPTSPATTTTFTHRQSSSSSSAAAAPGPSSPTAATASGENTTTNAGDQPKKKRRIQPTLHTTNWHTT